jgi:hypothetical protein
MEIELIGRALLIFALSIVGLYLVCLIGLVAIRFAHPDNYLEFKMAHRKWEATGRANHERWGHCSWMISLFFWFVHPLAVAWRPIRRVYRH